MDPEHPPQPPLPDTTGAAHMSGEPDNFVSQDCSHFSAKRLRAQNEGRRFAALLVLKEVTSTRKRAVDDRHGSSSLTPPKQPHEETRLWEYSSSIKNMQFCATAPGFQPSPKQLIVQQPKDKGSSPSAVCGGVGGYADH
ncbi:hypothetical protein JOB18_036707 [Solea senegalensis]|uniref:Uncharacterized protein n=1 Tax=Solea senegalensis TaxID=28829 RepID=A0AAV6RZU8_SOLSE|nr:hypothetical protein JOB18_036707 [Solea senegalensis]